MHPALLQPTGTHIDSEVDALGSDNEYSEWEGLTHPQIKRRRSVADLTFMCPFTYYLVYVFGMQQSSRLLLLIS